ncbi:MAG: purine-nucleoside phosphorylase [Akkermansiaceae bacterium]
MTPHINAKAGDFAETCLLPGDPLRAKFIAETFLDDVKQVNSVRNMFGYTGTYNGKRVSVMGTGMGIPSSSIYATELVTKYGVKNLVRVGSCGAVSKDVKVRDIVMGIGASTDSGVNRARFRGMDFSASADYGLLRRAVDVAEEKGYAVQVGNLFSADLFYHPEPAVFDTLEAMNILGVEMEAAGLYGIAAENYELGVKALAICTVSDHIRTGESLPPEERQSSFTEMMEVALGIL